MDEDIINTHAEHDLSSIQPQVTSYAQAGLPLAYDGGSLPAIEQGAYARASPYIRAPYAQGLEHDAHGMEQAYVGGIGHTVEPVKAFMDEDVVSARFSPIVQDAYAYVNDYPYAHGTEHDYARMEYYSQPSRIRNAQTQTGSGRMIRYDP